MTIKITTWNVNGLRALIGKNGLDPVLSLNPDVLMLQEIKTRPDQIPPGKNQLWKDYQDYWHPAEKPGYSGVASFVTLPPMEIKHGLGLARFDQEGRALIKRFADFIVINAYFPSGQRGYERINYKLDFYSALLDLCDDFHRQGYGVIIGGDFNTAHNEIDLRYPRENRKTSGFLPEERVWIDRYLEHGFVDVFRRLYPDRVAYTWWTYRLNARERNIGWRLDYFLISNSIVDRVGEVIVHPEIVGSDHCPVTLCLD